MGRGVKLIFLKILMNLDSSVFRRRGQTLRQSFPGTSRQWLGLGMNGLRNDRQYGNKCRWVKRSLRLFTLLAEGLHGIKV